MQAPGRIYPGTIVRVTVDCIDINDVIGDPATVTFKVMSPSRGQSSYVYGTNSEVTRSSIGRYVLAIPSASLNEGGRWFWRVETTGATYAYEESFIVQDSPFSQWTEEAYS